MLKHLNVSMENINKVSSIMRQRVYGEDLHMKLAVFNAPGRIPYREAVRGRFRPAKNGEEYGPMWSTHWFKAEGAVPAAWKGRDIVFMFDSGAEVLIWKDGEPLQGITNTCWPAGDVVPIRPYYHVTRKAKGGEKVSFYLEMACNGYWGYMKDPSQPPMRQDYKVHGARLVCFNRDAWDFWVRIDVLVRLARCLPNGNPRKDSAIAAANEMVRRCDVNDPATWREAVHGSDDYFSARQTGKFFEMSAIGNAHIDVAWLWPVAETIRKCARSYSAQIRLMEQYPDYLFACSQALTLQWMKDYYPSLYKEIKAYFKKGRFLPVGGAWLEPDCNIPSGESLARQFLWGQRFFRKEFGVTCKEFWQPDVFGYSAALPQIMLQSGMENFYTIKLGWNQFNVPVSTTFWWEGLDGSRVLAHIPQGDSWMEPDRLFELMANYRDHERGSELCAAFGIGDGGGGPTEFMLDRYELIKDLPAMPHLKMRSVAEFFERARKDMKDPLVWSGELYFERHRGTYTTEAATKTGNRRGEELLHDLEFLYSATQLLGRAKYPTAAIHGIWEKVLLNQFHDILPGSSIVEVYEDAARDYAAVQSEGGVLRAKAVSALAAVSAKGSNLLVVNTLSFARHEVVETSKGAVLVDAPSMGYAITRPQHTMDRVEVMNTGDGFVLENVSLRAVINRQGRLVSLFDKNSQREAVARDARANQFVMFDDDPVICDAWDIDINHLEKRREVGEVKSMRVKAVGGLIGSVEVEMKLSAVSSIRQVISLAADSSRLDFSCEVDWHESHKFLKVEFPLDLRCEFATYEVQYGHLRRPTHFNTSWDWARFEVPAQRWADLSEPAFGVALLNDCKYGYACHGNVMRLSLLRSSKHPNETADMGRQVFRYALYPHGGMPQAAGVVQAAAAFNQPMTVVPTTSDEQVQCFFSISNPAIVIDTVKKAEDSDDIIVRLYESSGSKQSGVLTTGLPLKAARLVNLLEDDQKRVKWQNGLKLELTPFQLVSYRFVSTSR